MDLPPVNHLTKGNLTQRHREDPMDLSVWEPHTVIIVVVFGLVCLLHLTAFLYAVCLQSYVNAGSQAFTHPSHYMRKDGEKTVFYRFMSRLLIEHRDTGQKERDPIMITI